jgi:hypothetical protein
MKGSKCAHVHHLSRVQHWVLAVDPHLTVVARFDPNSLIEAAIATGITRFLLWSGSMTAATWKMVQS